MVNTPRLRLSWRNNELYAGERRMKVAIVLDRKYPEMWRVRYPDGYLSDMVNKTRAKDAAITMAASLL